MKKRRSLSCANCPFWLLIAAWFCANVPSMATAHAFGWLNGARHFSHYAELRLSVASLLSKQLPAAAVVANADPVSRSAPPAMPVDGMVKKIDLSLTPTPLRLIGTRLGTSGGNTCMCLPVCPAIEVPYPPPRSSERSA